MRNCLCACRTEIRHDGGRRKNPSNHKSFQPSSFACVQSVTTQTKTSVSSHVTVSLENLGMHVRKSESSLSCRCERNCLTFSVHCKNQQKVRFANPELLNSGDTHVKDADLPYGYLQTINMGVHQRHYVVPLVPVLAPVAAFAFQPQLWRCVHPPPQYPHNWSVCRS